MERRPSLDGVRALCAAAVFASHAFPGSGGGFFGVDVFFVLSGYLITRVLVDDVDRYGRVRFGRFYAHRARRLLPAMIVALALAFALWPAGQREQFAGIVPPVLLYYVNWCLAFGRAIPVVPHFWTLSVEEQFYLLWPLVVAVVAARGQRTLAIVSCVLVIAFAAARALCSFVGPPAAEVFGYSSTLARADQFLVGACAAAAHVSLDRVWRHKLTRAAGALVWPAALALLALFVTGGIGRWLPMGGFTAIAVASALVVIHCATGDASCFNRLLGARPLVWVGRRSYGIYLFHLPIIEALEPLRHPGFGNAFAVTALSVMATLGLTWASYELVESRVMASPRAASPSLSSSV